MPLALGLKEEKIDAKKVFKSCAKDADMK